MSCITLWERSNTTTGLPSAEKFFIIKLKDVYFTEICGSLSCLLSALEKVSECGDTYSRPCPYLYKDGLMHCIYDEGQGFFSIFFNNFENASSPPLGNHSWVITTKNFRNCQWQALHLTHIVHGCLHVSHTARIIVLQGIV